METLKFGASHPRVLDTSDPGIGKTRAHIEIYRARQKAKRGRLLVVCPKTLMYSAWGDDLNKFAPELSVSFATAAQRNEAFEMETDVVVINTDGVKWLGQKENRKYLLAFDHLIVDEFSYFKHHNSQRSKALAQLRKYFEHRYLLSGTPMSNTVMELWHPALICDDGKRLGTSYHKLRNSVQIAEQIGPGINHVKWKDKPGAVQAVHELLADITVRHAFEDVMTHVPPNHRDVKQFKLSPKAQKYYDKMANDCILALDDATVTAVHAASLRTKLLQIASGAVYAQGEDSDYQLLDTQRYEMIADIIENREHSVVFFNWRHQRDELLKELDKRGMTFAVIDGSIPQRERDNIVTAYQEGKYQTILLHPRTGAHGLTLTRGTTTIVCSPIYEADLLKQGIHRIYRGSQNQVTNTILVQAKDTVEDLVYARLDQKTESMEDLLQLMRNRSKKK